MKINNTQQTPFQVNLVIHFPDKRLCTSANARKCAEASGKIVGKMGYSPDLDETHYLVCDTSTEISLKVKEAFEALQKAREIYKKSTYSTELRIAFNKAKRAFEEAKRIVAGNKIETETIEYTDYIKD